MIDLIKSIGFVHKDTTVGAGVGGLDRFVHASVAWRGNCPSYKKLRTWSCQESPREAPARVIRLARFDGWGDYTFVQTWCNKNLNVEIEVDELGSIAIESKATYAQIKEYILENFILKVSAWLHRLIKCMREHDKKSKEKMKRMKKHLGIAMVLITILSLTAYVSNKK